MGAREDLYSEIRPLPRQVLIYADIDTAGDLPASKNYVDAHSGGGGVSDGNKGDITVSGSGTTWELNATAMRKIMAINAS